MYLIQIFLPLYNNAKEPLPKTLFGQTRDELMNRFGGLTAYTRSPASGLWQENQQHTTHDDLVTYEVMVNTLDEQWWHDYRTTLEDRFQQESLIVRAQEVKLL